jgi:hypothetical protein
VEAAVIDAAGHGRKRSQGIDGVEVAEEEDRFDLGYAGEIDLEVIAEIIDAMEVRTATDEGELLREMGTHTIGRGFVVARGLDPDEFADSSEDGVLAGLEVVETLFWSAVLFFAWHVLSS